MIRALVILFGTCWVLHAYAQSPVASPCDGPAHISGSRLDDLVVTDSLVRDPLHPAAERIVRLRERLGEYGLPKEPSHQVLQLCDGFNGEVMIWADDTLLFSGHARTERSTSVTNVIVDLGPRSEQHAKTLRIRNGEHCMQAKLDGAYPVVMVYCIRGSWTVNMSDYWPIAQ